MKSKKKSEMLEVRLSHEDKQALQAKAAREGRTVSFVVRRLISDYLTPPETRSQPSRLQELLMTLKSKPKSSLAIITAFVLTPFGIASFASAEDLSLRINGEYSQPMIDNGTEAKRVRTWDFEVVMETNGTATLEVPAASDGLQIKITTEELETGLSLKFAILEDGEPWGMSRELGAYKSPSLITNYDTPVAIEIGYESGEMFKMSALPSKLSD